MFCARGSEGLGFRMMGGGASQAAYHLLELSNSISGLVSDLVEALHLGHKYYFSMPVH